MRARILLFLIFCVVLACKKQKKPDAHCSDDHALYTYADFPVGVAVNMDSLLSGSMYHSTVTKQFNSITPENIFKPSFLHPNEHNYDWYLADLLVNYCSRNSKHLHGHTLIWHSQLPRWMEDYQGTPEEWDNMFKAHIQTIIKHFKGKVKAWDVVNEAFNQDGTLRETIWKQHVGADYIEKAFRYAHEADPDVLLFYNDFFLETNPTKRKNVLSYLNKIKARGAVVDGIGMQFHVSTVYPDLSQVAEALKEVSDNGYPIHISELDISLNPFYKDIEPSESLFKRQGEIMASIVMHYRQLPAKHQYGITLWGLHDAQGGISPYYGREDYPWIYDHSYKPKPAYCQLKEQL